MHDHHHGGRDHPPGTGGPPAPAPGSAAGEADDGRRLLGALWLTGGFVLVEVAGGLFSGSLALLADAGHMLTDAAALGLACIAVRVAARPGDTRRSYGYHRFPVLAAYVNAVTLLLIVAWIAVEAVARVREPVEILEGPMLAVAGVGLLVNLAAFRLLHGGESDSLNVRGALVHVLGDSARLGRRDRRRAGDPGDRMDPRRPDSVAARRLPGAEERGLAAAPVGPRPDGRSSRAPRRGGRGADRRRGGSRGRQRAPRPHLVARSRPAGDDLSRSGRPESGPRPRPGARARLPARTVRGTARDRSVGTCTVRGLRGVLGPCRVGLPALSRAAPVRHPSD